MQHLQPNTTLQGGKYRIERVLGQGGFGNTYLGYNTEFEETVAIKEFFMKGVTERDETTSVVSVSNADNVQQFEEQREKFKKEARRLRKLKSKHIVNVHDLFEENGTAYYVMDYVDGESLAERLKRTGKAFSEDEVRAILPQVLEALQEVHSNEIWHLDLKPGNIMIDKKGKVYLIDFGASKQIRANGSMTTSSALCYTPGYAPNEQIGQMYDRFGPWTDIYALGATIYNLLTNKKPPMAIDIEEDEEDAFDFPKSVSEAMRKQVIWMMQPKRKKRPQSVDEVIEQMGNQPKEEMPLPQEDTSESEETILLTPVSNDDNVEPIGQDNPPKEDIVKEEEARTILVVSKGDGKTYLNKPSTHTLPPRAIKVGDFIFEDGCYSAERGDDEKRVVGALFSYYGGDHGLIMSPVKQSDDLSINGKKLEWHEASIAEWVEVIQNLGKTKVSFVTWDYRYYSKEVKEILKEYGVTEDRYITKKSINGISYSIELGLCTMMPLGDDVQSLPYIYIAEF